MFDLFLVVHTEETHKLSRESQDIIIYYLIPLLSTDYK